MPKSNNKLEGFDNSTFLTTMPAQAIHSSKKTEKWAEQTIDAIDSFSNTSIGEGRTTRENKKINYDLINNIFDPADFKYVTDQFNLGIKEEKQQARIRNINLIANKINLLKGDELENPFNWTAMGLGGEIVSVIEEKRKEVIVNAVRDVVRFELGIEQEFDKDGNPLPPADPQRVIENFDKTYKDIREINANRLLQILWEDLDLKTKFNKGWEHALVGAEEIYYVGEVGGKPNVRVVNPLNFDYDRSPELDNVEDGDWAREERYLSPGTIIDEYGDFLTTQQVRDIESGVISNPARDTFFFPEFAYKPIDLKIHLSRYGTSSNTNSPRYIRVLDVVWKTRKKLGFVRQVTDDGQVEETIVDDTFKLSSEQKDAGVTIEWRWINEVMKGTKIGTDIYVDIGAIPYQMRHPDNISECKLPYVGRIYNNLNSVETSLVDILKPHQYLYNIIWYRLESEIAKAKGKATIMDLAQLPKSEGIDITEWIYYLNEAGVMFINSFEEGEENSVSQGKTSNFNQFREIDRAASQSIGQYISILSKIESLFDTIAGIPPQRQAQTSSSETATGVERAVRQSTTITAPYFYVHDRVKQQVLTQLVEVCKYSYSEGKKGLFYVDETYRQMIDVDGETFTDSYYAVFIVNGVAHKIKLDKMERAAEIAMGNGQIQLKDFIKLIRATSLSEKENAVEKGVDDTQQRSIELEQQRNISIERAAQTNQQTEQLKQDREDAREQLKSNTSIKVAQINAVAKVGFTDTDSNDVPDILELERFGLESRKLTLAEKKQLADEANAKEKLRIEEKKTDNQLKIAKENKNKFDKKS